MLALSFNLFLLPNSIVSGGMSGISILVKHFFGIEPSFFMAIASVFLLILSYLTLGRKKTMGSIIGSFLFPLLVKLTSSIPIYFTVDNSNVLLCAIFGGVISGIGIGLIFKAGFTTGGTDIINQIVSKYSKISMGKAILIDDGLIVIAGAFAFGITKMMYALVVLYIVSLITDKVLLGISDCKAFYIMTEKPDEIKQFILKDLGHGVTIIPVKGGYTKEKEKMLFCVIPTKEYFKLKEGIHNIDSESFFVITDAYEVHGGE